MKAYGKAESCAVQGFFGDGGGGVPISPLGIILLFLFM